MMDFDKQLSRAKAEIRQLEEEAKTLWSTWHVAALAVGSFIVGAFFGHLV